MELNIRSIFYPSVGVDIVFNINSLTPLSRSSIIYDTDFDRQTVTIAQPLTPLSIKTAFKDLHLSTIFNEKNRKIRVGILCDQFEIIERYPLANNKTVGAVKLHYCPPAKEINIRSAFRLPLSTKFIIKGKMRYQNRDYYTSRDFAIRDISLSGVGILIPKKRGGSDNPLSGLKLNDKIRMGVILVNMDKDTPLGTLPIVVQVSRVQQNFSDTRSLMGLKIVSIKPDSETLLNRFIHDAQIDELKRLSRRNL